MSIEYYPTVLANLALNQRNDAFLLQCLLKYKRNGSLS